MKPPARYADASPLRRLPLGVAQYVAHGDRDELLPLAVTQHYVDSAIAAGDRVEFDQLRGCGHMEFINPNMPAFVALLRWIDHTLG